MTLLPNLMTSGSVGLVWPRLRHRAAEYGAAGIALEHAYQSQLQHNRRAEQEIARIAARLHRVGIRPVLIKGWALARLYPPPSVRATGDIDLVVQDSDYRRAIETLVRGDDDDPPVSLSLHGDEGLQIRLAREMSGRSPAGSVDLHGFSRWGEVVDPDFFVDAQGVAVDEGEINVPRFEDHLRALCLHFLRHSAVRPSRLCDIALLLETRPPDFDWDRCLRGGRRTEEHTAVTLRLAHELLGACIDGTPVVERTHRLPVWVAPQVVQHWEQPPETFGQVLPEILANPHGIFRTFIRRWPDPIMATSMVNAPFIRVPRTAVQAAAYIKRIASYSLSRLPRQFKEMHLP